jgi:hypothetical protein
MPIENMHAVAHAVCTRWEPIVIASFYLSTVAGEELLTVQAYDLDPYVTLTIREHSVDLTRDEARRAADALRACACTDEGS